MKELTFQQEEDNKNHERMQELVDKLQGKVTLNCSVLSPIQNDLTVLKFSGEVLQEAN